ncbi:2-dehydro-3-deoxygluconokinase [Sphaerotilus hippei]|uniref:2-dehydro-3-deoxygluconokinase n=1 Tax=Sphaerotilus hippei TaxID=744406 RepID=A0A318H5H0_9BURK|nr:sugar kinase [Sphaerotilus hippei]PXW97501.1 2-dehydro-3-deoxygluconokinase [Sphaerotilus hippei]
MKPPEQAAAAGRQVAVFGECMIELQGEPFGPLRQSYGGDTLNTAVYLARLGARHGIRACYATGLGDDVYSQGLVQRWQAEGIDTSLVRHLAGRLPGMYSIHLDASGERQFAYWRDSSAARSYFDVPQTPLEQAGADIDTLYFSGISLAILPDAARLRLLDLARRLRARGGRVVFDNNYRPRLWPDAEVAQAWFAQAFACTDIALVTADDERLLHGLPTLDAAVARSLALPASEVVIKRGAQPVIVRRADGTTVEVAAVPVARVVDTTAAGDSFAAGYLCARMIGRDVESAAKLGHALAAEVIQHAGAIIPATATDRWNPG